MAVHRGEIYYADLSPVVGSEQGGVRPVLIVQNEVGNRFSPTVIAAAITSQQEKADLPTHIHVQADRNGLQKDSIVLLEQIRTLIRRFRSASGCRAGAGADRILKRVRSKKREGPAVLLTKNGPVLCYTENHGRGEEGWSSMWMNCCFSMR